jgi:hypothetical protein
MYYPGERGTNVLQAASDDHRQHLRQLMREVLHQDIVQSRPISMEDASERRRLDERVDFTAQFFQMLVRSGQLDPAALR